MLERLCKQLYLLKKVIPVLHLFYQQGGDGIMIGVAGLSIVSLSVLVGVAVFSYGQYRGFEAHIQFLKAAMEGAFVVCSLYWVFEGMARAGERFVGIPQVLFRTQLAYWFAALVASKLLPKMLQEAILVRYQSGWTALLCWAVAIAFWATSAAAANAHRLPIVARWIEDKGGAYL